ncbi:hypothetical protein CC80DRAFT_597996 [Byssothecium circinans]|uniref:Uncharacterized protein n=1 Tax=Byssothecium circinans TaxID=147558 RepID=A0A6A5TP85_9PLEO|nr:hypothetical protein CC80DRAFT_597996 [Byssothecium circinans]
MAPPKKISTTTTTSRGPNTRTHLSPNHHPSSSALPNDTSEDADGMDGQQHTEPEDSQGAPDAKLQRLMEDMVDTQRKRHAARKAKVHKAYTKSHAETREDITAIFDQHAKDAAQARTAQLQRLRQLIAQKTEVEKRMADKFAELRKEYLKHAESLQRVVEYRARELR